MNPAAAHDTKDWHMAPNSIQSHCIPEGSMPNSPQVQHYPSIPPMNHHYNQQFHPTAQLHSPIQPVPPTSNYLSSAKSDSDAQLPSMMTHSQPGTPLPNQSSPVSNKEPSSYFHGTPYAASTTVIRKRGRSDLFSNELGPFFSSTKPADNLFALDRSTLLNVRIQAKMDRGFFLADNDWTCYRRNYFQVSGAFTIHGLNHYYSEHEPHCLVQVDNMFYPVLGFSMNISARVSNSDKKIELVQHTPKRDKGPQTTPMPKFVVPGGNLSMSSVGATQTIVTFERIQFKTATANNGKRRAAQQYYVCIVDLFAEIEGNQRVKVASCQSAPLVVRGRSPGHYSDNQIRYENGFTGPSGIPPPPPPHSQHDDRFTNAAFPQTPITPPGMLAPGPTAGEYGSPYAYQPYAGYSQFHSMPGAATVMPPTPTGSLHPPTGPMHQQPHPHATQSFAHQQHHHHHQPYLMPGMSSEPSSSETSSPDVYRNGGFAAHRGLHSHERTPAYTYQQPPPTSAGSGMISMAIERNTAANGYKYPHRMNSNENRLSPVVYEQQQSPAPSTTTATSYFSPTMSNPHAQTNTYNSNANTSATTSVIAP